MCFKSQRLSKIRMCDANNTFASQMLQCKVRFTLSGGQRFHPFYSATVGPLGSYPTSLIQNSSISFPCNFTAFTSKDRDYQPHPRVGGSESTGGSGVRLRRQRGKSASMQPPPPSLAVVCGADVPVLLPLLV
uniref:Uncharacterized protein n=1 Tax=Sphaerodactylus townsendi TaxID=933632 RepID=A0ACB8FYR6_9SAUR